MSCLIKELVGALLSQLREIQGEWERELHRRRYSVQILVSQRARLIRHGPGRPYFDITEDLLYTLQSLGFSWTSIAEILGIYICIYACIRTIVWRANSAHAFLLRMVRRLTLTSVYSTMRSVHVCKIYRFSHEIDRLPSKVRRPPDH